MDRELLYNKSHLKDLTAYQAIKNVENGGTENMDGYEINKGEIWKALNGEREVYVVVLNCFERYVATITLQEREPGSNAVPVRVYDIMYADAGRLGYTFYDKMVDYVRTLSAYEEMGLRQAISEALELGEINQEQATRAVEFQEAATEAATAKLEEARKEVTYLREELEKQKEIVAKQAEELLYKMAPGRGVVEAVTENELRKSLEMAEREAQIYKELYEKLLARALG